MPDVFEKTHKPQSPCQELRTTFWQGFDQPALEQTAIDLSRRDLKHLLHHQGPSQHPRGLITFLSQRPVRRKDVSEVPKICVAAQLIFENAN